MTLVYKNISYSSLLLERLTLAASVRKRLRWRMLTQTGKGQLYWPFLNPCCNSIFRALSLLLWKKVLYWGHPGLPAASSGHLPATLWTSWLPKSLLLTDWPQLTVTDHGYPCMNNFILPTYFFKLVIHMICFWLSSHVGCPLVYTAGISCLEILTWRVCQRSICCSFLRHNSFFSSGVFLSYIYIYISISRGTIMARHLKQLMHVCHQKQVRWQEIQKYMQRTMLETREVTSLKMDAMINNIRQSQGFTGSVGISTCRINLYNLFYCIELI